MITADYGYIISVLSIVPQKFNKRVLIFVLMSSRLQIDNYGGGIMDKTNVYEAVCRHDIFIWVL